VVVIMYTAQVIVPRSGVIMVNQNLQSDQLDIERHWIFIGVSIVLGFLFSCACIGMLIINARAASVAEQATPTIAPTATLLPTPTTEPTATPEEASPEEEEYQLLVSDSMQALNDDLLDIGSLFEDAGANAGLFSDALWNEALDEAVTRVNDVNTSVSEATPPEGYEDVHDRIVFVFGVCNDAANGLNQGLESLDSALLEQSTGLLVDCTTELQDLQPELEENGLSDG